MSQNARLGDAVAEFICRANYGLPFGAFTFNVDTGEIDFVATLDGVSLQKNPQNVDNLFAALIESVERYDVGVVSVLCQTMTPYEALHMCEDDE